jgi:hypothetical protein
MLTTTLSPILEFDTELQCRYGAQDWDEVLLPEIERQQELGKEGSFGRMPRLPNRKFTKRWKSGG